MGACSCAVAAIDSRNAKVPVFVWWSFLEPRDLRRGHCRCNSGARASGRRPAQPRASDSREAGVAAVQVDDAGREALYWPCSGLVRAKRAGKARLGRRDGATTRFCDGAVAQLVERIVRNDEVGSSTLLRSTSVKTPVTAGVFAFGRRLGVGGASGSGYFGTRTRDPGFTPFTDATASRLLCKGVSFCAEHTARIRANESKYGPRPLRLLATFFPERKGPGTLRRARI